MENVLDMTLGEIIKELTRRIHVHNELMDEVLGSAATLEDKQEQLYLMRDLRIAEVLAVVMRLNTESEQPLHTLYEYVDALLEEIGTSTGNIEMMDYEIEARDAKDSITHDQ